MRASMLGPGLSIGQRAVIYGVLGGSMMIELEFLVLTRRLVAANWVELRVHLMMQWIPAGIAIAYFALRSNGRHSGMRMAASLIVFAAVLSAVIVGVREGVRATGVVISPGPLTTPPPLPSFFYTFWITLFYGGLFMAACAQSARAEWTRHALACAEIERHRSEIVLAEAALQTLRARVDPNVLQRAVSELARRYDTDARAMDRLLDALVAFLRCAMPGVRDRPATLHGELRLVAAYARLWAELDPHRPRWRVVGDPGLVDAPFPGFWLTAALDHWSSVAATGATCDVCVRSSPAGLTLTLDATSPGGDWIAKVLDHHLRVDLHSVFGDAARLTFRSAAAPGVPLLSLVLSGVPDRPASHGADFARAGLGLNAPAGA